MNDKTKTAQPARWRRRLLIVVGLLVLLIAAAPAIVVSLFGAGLVKEALAEATGSEVGELSLSGGWFSDLRIEDLSLRKPGASEPWLVVPTGKVDTGLLGLALGSDPLVVRLEQPVVRMKAEPGFGWPAFPPSEPTPDGPPPELPDRPLHLHIAGGRALLGPDLEVAFDLEAGSKGRTGASLQGHIRWNGTEAMELGGEADWASGTPTGQVSLRALTNVPLAPLGTFLRGLGGPELGGELAALQLIARSDEGQLIGDLTLEARDLAVPGAPALALVQGRISGALKDEVVSQFEAALTLRESSGAEGVVRIGPGASLGLGARPSCDATLRVQVPEARSLAPFLPAGLKLEGPLRAEGHVLGELAADPADPGSWVAALPGTSLEVALGGLTAEGLASPVRDLRLKASVADGQLKLSELRAALGEGMVRVAGAYAPAAPAQSVGLTATIDPPLALRSFLPADLGVAGRLGGEISLKPAGHDLRIAPQLKLSGPTWTPSGGPAMPLPDLSLAGAVTAASDFSAFRADQLSLQGPPSLVLTLRELSGTRTEAGLSLGGVLGGEVHAALLQRLSAPFGLNAALFDTGAGLQVADARFGLEAGGRVVLDLDALRLPHLDLNTFHQGLGTLADVVVAARLSREADGALAVASCRLKARGLELQGEGLTFLPDGVLRGALRAQLDAEAVTRHVGGFLPEAAGRLEGPLRLEGQFSGLQLDAPEAAAKALSGEMQLVLGRVVREGIAYEAPTLDLAVNAGRAEAAASFRADGGEGKLTARGPVGTSTAADPLTARLELTRLPVRLALAEDAHVASRLSGALDLGLPEGFAQLNARGELTFTELLRTDAAGTQRFDDGLLQLTARAWTRGDAEVGRALLRLGSEADPALLVQLQDLSLTEALAVGQCQLTLAPAGVALLAPDAGVDLRGPLVFTGQLQGPRPDRDEDAWTKMSGGGQLALPQIVVEGLPIGPGTVPVVVASGRVGLKEDARIPLAGGQLRLGAKSGYQIAPTARFDLDLAVEAVQVDHRFAPLLTLAHPMFALQGAQGSRLGGQLNGRIVLGGALEGDTWWEGVGGDVQLGFKNLEVQGSSLLAGLARGLPPALEGGAAALLGRLSREGEDPRTMLAALDTRGLRFADLNLGLSAASGQLRLKEALRIDLGDFALLVDGGARLDGSLKATVRTDLMERLLAKAVPQRPDNPLSAILGAVNPLKALFGQVLSADVTGNAFMPAAGFTVRPTLGKGR